jgi:hypothetical protein
MKKNNVLCKHCNSVIYESESETAIQIADIKALPDIEIDVKPVSDPLADHLVSEIEITIAEMETYQESFNTSKKHLKELKMSRGTPVCPPGREMGVG